MSLHIGNLSSRIRRDDLERVFRRFGRCSIRVKDKYGFVVYDYPASAEKALKTLQGTRICGQAVTLSWSNHQPCAPQRFGLGGKSYRPPHRKYSVKENAGRRLGSNDRQDYERNFKRADEARARGSSDLVDESTSYHPDDMEGYAGEMGYTSMNDHDVVGGARKNILEDDRWGEQVLDPSYENYFENGIEFDRYEPDHSVGIKELDEHQTISPLAESPTIRKFEETTGNIYHRKSKKNCYLCGEVGHKMRNCPLELKQPLSRSRGRIFLGGDAVPSSCQESDRAPSTSRNRRRLLGRGDSPPLQTTSSGKKKEYRDKKRNRKNYESQDKNHFARAGGPSSSSINSGYTSFRLQSPSRSLRSLSRPPSLSKLESVPSNKNSMSSSLSSSPSHHSASENFKSPSVSESMSPTSLLLPLENNRHLSPPSNNIKTDSKDSVTNAVGLSHKTDQLEEETLVRSGTGTSKSENIISEAENECERMKDLPEKDNEHHQSVPKDSHEQLPQSDGDDHIGDNLLVHRASDTRDSINKNLVGEHKLASESDIPVRSNANDLKRMSSEEIFMVLKHYGLQYPEENEDLPVESYFGSARLWPWEIIYYRRLKKGPVSAENYSLRIVQNEEFGIVDKYIRGSSGWGEWNESNP